MIQEHPWYRWYVLFVLTLIYAFGYIDRQIVTILAPYLRKDLGITDAQLGLLYGTSFALFYSVFGIPLARLADGWSRVRTLALGLSFWSLMTAISGLSRNFTTLGIARIGVGVGEASSSPAAVSLLGDYFEKARRGTVLAIYSVGVYIGAGASLSIGGAIVSAWQRAYGTTPSAAPFGLAGWQVSFMTIGLPGIIFALVVLLTIREPRRGRLEDALPRTEPRPFARAVRELGAMVPPWNWMHMARIGASRSEYARNGVSLFGAVCLVIFATMATNHILSTSHNATVGSIFGWPVTTNLIQWLAMAIAVYLCANWYQATRLGDDSVRRLITGSRTFVALTVAGAFLAFAMNAVNAFVFVYASRNLGLTAEAGLRLGIIAILSGGTGITVSGYLGDYAKKLHRLGRLYFVCVTASIFTLASALQYTTRSVTVFYCAYAAATLFVPMWFGPLLATTQDIVTPRLRGTALAAYFLGPNIFGLGLGPYFVGLVSDATGDLRLAILLAIAVLPIPVVSLLVAGRHLANAEHAAASELQPNQHMKGVAPDIHAAPQIGES
ncbi:major facilitator transporter [Burkholderia multivorans]|uniref:spinster family MFS transporter n=1 Tax=Burkholderia multivorans TaxID=87883 RepID=UPI001992D5C3|nr:MFS transporter [Burkholderia multivorans]MBU9669187.1 MFS transporter [Burkholderia multivorans]CAB5300929.1 major facilitator transporter [Burkholderia multivorans]CAB5305597.1 major facilitator transporter [Burkholderia multivorans]CAB5310442.1 major facilitator transporter [Burkholderia multivorans]CAB5312465.1 major facilitator transporter [Burkholderia multivorans]